MSHQIIDAFIEVNGTVEDWGGDREGWRQSLGAFTLGWLASKKAVEHRLAADDVVRCAECSYILKPSWNHCPDCGHPITAKA